MEKIQLQATLREKKAHVGKLRKGGEIPAVLYGHGIKNASLTIKKSDFDRVYKKAGESTIVELSTGEGKPHPVLIHDVQEHFLTGEPIHVDFYQVSMTEKLKAEVALEYIGEAPAVKALGGVMVRVLNQVEVQCLPQDLPHNIEVDISALKTFQNVIHIRDLKVAAGVQIMTPGEEVVAKVQPPRDIEAEIAAVPIDEKAAVEAAVAASEKPKAEGEPEEAEAKEAKPKKE